MATGQTSSVTRTFLIVAIVGFVATLNAFFPRRDRVLLVGSFFSAWLTVELAPWLLFWEAVGLAYFTSQGAVDGAAGVVALVLAAITCIGLIVMIVWSRRTVVTMRDAIADLDVDGDAPQFPRAHVVFPILMRHRAGVDRTRNITFAEYGKKRIKLDVYKSADAKPGDLRPGVLQIHGGGWVFGDKREQGIP